MFNFGNYGLRSLWIFDDPHIWGLSAFSLTPQQIFMSLKVVAVENVCAGQDGCNQWGGADGAEEEVAQLPREVFLPRLLWRLLQAGR